MIGLVIFFISIAIIIAIYAFFGTVILSIGFVRNFLCNIQIFKTFSGCITCIQPWILTVQLGKFS